MIDVKKRSLNGQGADETAHEPKPARPPGQPGAYRAILVVVAFLALATAVWGVAADRHLDWPDMLAGCLGLASALLFYRSGR